MKELMFFDAVSLVGNRVDRKFPDVSELLADMDRFGVDRALIQHNAVGMLGAEKANRRLVEILKEDDPEQRLECVWCLLPAQCGELPEPGEFFEAMRRNNVHALTIDPFNHRYVPCRLTLGKYLDEAIKRNIPVFLNSFAGKWNELYAFLKEFPELCCVVHGGDKWCNDRYLRPLLENYPGVHVELSGYWVPEGIADLAKTYGAERLLYASGFPRYDHGAAMLQLKHSGLSDEEISLIAGKNLERLLGGREKLSFQQKKSIWEQENTIAGSVWKNGRADFPVCDVHAHMGRHYAMYHARGEAEDMVRHARRPGVRRLCFSHNDALFDVGGNRIAAEICRRYPDILRMYVGINPNYPEQVRKDLAEFDSWAPYAVGLKILADYHKVKATDLSYKEALEFASRRELPVLFHTWGGSSCDGSEVMLELIKRYPKIKFLLGHSIFGDWDGAERCFREGNGNVYLELTAIPGERGIIKDLVRRVGSSHILYGTDLPWFDEYQALGGVLSADISEEDIRNILYRNADNLFGKDW